MNQITFSKRLLGFILLTIVGSYLFIFLERDSPGTFLYNAGTFLYTVIPLGASFILLIASRKSHKKEKNFWLFLSLGYFSSFLAILVWDYYDFVRDVDVPFPGIPDLFYMIQYVFFFSALLYRVKAGKSRSLFTRQIIDILIVMLVAIAFSWSFLVQPIVTNPQFAGMYQFVSMGYAIGDIGLLILAFSILIMSPTMIQRNSLIFIFMGLIVQAVADSIYVYLQASVSYTSWSYIDPLYLFAYMLIGFAGYNRIKLGNSECLFMGTDSRMKMSSTFRLLIPYGALVALSIFVLTSEDHHNHLILITSVMSMCLIILRQVLTIIESKQFLRQYEQKEKELNFNEQRFRSLFDHNEDAVISLDRVGRINSINERAIQLSGYQPHEIISERLMNLLMEKDVGRIRRLFRVAICGKSTSAEVKVILHDQEEKSLFVTLVPIFIDEKVKGVFCIARDITENKKNEEKISFLAYHDPLTNLPNRRLFEEKLSKAIENAKQKNTTLATLFIDLDFFKVINDHFGHETGDIILVQVARRIQGTLLPQDMVMRHAGDEFIVMLMDRQTEHEVEQVARKISERISEPFIVGRHEIRVTSSIGISLLSDEVSDPEKLIRNADIAMYRSKGQGKNQYCFYEEEKEEQSSRDLTIEKELGTVLQTNQLTVYYQPQLNIMDGNIVGMEALVRWIHPELGMISPNEFIPLAEKNGSIFDINEYVLVEACKQAKHWHVKGLPIKISVNISPQQFYHQKNLSEVVQSALEVSGLDGSYLELEITEAIVIHKRGTAIEKLNELKKLGVSISLDDFGTGYSSLSYLTDLPIDTIKIAREFIEKMDQRKEVQIILSSIVTMANELGKRLIIEGVEEMEQLRVLEDMKCYLMQGYLFYRPADAIKTNEILEQQLLKEHVSKE
ncbi:EAL domain-containing protein [Radiobacillus kanasensis]|uniref:EAL domain-containing protein n=1 Tax=Radiobacillus kanasensis TaxID=2844358 RepID=UPI001E45F98F|nr:EAL domain-containing protein [Radiobacillus kanasensis]UFU00803.1 EAL domain-containing protein [Radiobacillus kanasensis]